MADAAKCVHPSCECVVPPGGPFGKYCSEQCRKAGDITELHCNCQHPECRNPELFAARSPVRPSA